MARVLAKHTFLAYSGSFQNIKILEKRIPKADWESPITFHHTTRSSASKEVRYMHSCVLAVCEKTSSSGTSDGKEKILLAQRK